MKRRLRIRFRLVLATSIALIFVLLEGCYYMQAIGGQMEVMRKRRPLTELINDEATHAALRERLRMVATARDFAVEQLLLPDNGSYRSYADVNRDYIVWNVFAAPEFSLTPKQWCYPVAGCVAYRGYFAEKKANRKASRLKKSGFDVFVGGVAAYSTLGRFDDPILNTMLRWSDLSLVETLFHELAHQKLYVKGDTAFNESFATAVAEIGIERWVEKRSMQVESKKLGDSRALQEAVRQLVLLTRQDLESVYSSGLEITAMRAQKKAILDRLSQDATLAIDVSGVTASNWLAAPLNNARLVSLGVYQSHVSAFRALAGDCDNHLECFYTKSAELADLEFDERQKRLAELGGLQSPG